MPNMLQIVSNCAIIDTVGYSTLYPTPSCSVFFVSLRYTKKRRNGGEFCVRCTRTKIQAK